MAELALQPAITESGRKLPGRTPEEVERILTVLALSGSPKKASEQLEEEGITATDQLLRAWRDRTFPRRYLELRRALAQEIGENIAGKAFERALQADEAEEKLIDETLRRIHDIPAAQLAASVRAVSQAKTGSVETARLLRDQPTEIKEVRTVDELVSYLSRNEVVRVVEGTAEEIED